MSMHEDVSSSFAHDCQKVEAAQLPFSRRTGKLWHTQTTEYSSALKTNELSGHEQTWKELSCIV